MGSLSRNGRGTQRGFTLLEIILATVLLVGIGAVLFNAFATARRWVIESSNGVPMNLARERMDQLEMSVRSDTWDTGALKATALWTAEPAIVLDGVSYLRNTRVSAVAGRAYRRGDVKVSW